MENIWYFFCVSRKHLIEEHVLCSPLLLRMYDRGVCMTGLNLSYVLCCCEEHFVVENIWKIKSCHMISAVGEYVWQVWTYHLFSTVSENIFILCSPLLERIYVWRMYDCLGELFVVENIWYVKICCSLKPVICSPLDGEHLIYVLCQQRTFDEVTCLMFSAVWENVLQVWTYLMFSSIPENM